MKNKLGGPYLWEHLCETYTMDVRQKSMHLVVCHDGKKTTLKLIRNSMVGRGKLNLVSMDQMKDEQLVVVV